MNLQSWIDNVARALKCPAVTAGVTHRARRLATFFLNRMIFKMAQMKSVFAVLVAMMAPVCVVSAQTNYYTANGTEYPVVGALPGDQMFPEVSVSGGGGFVVWQDNATDGDGLGISAQRLDSSLSPFYGSFRVNADGAGDQQNPQVALLQNGGSVFVWQGGSAGNQHIYTRFLAPTGTFLTTNDVLVNSFTNSQQLNPGVAVLSNSNVVFVWSSYNQAASNSMQDVYGQIFSQAGVKLGGEFLINQFTAYNQRTPAVAPLANGGFAVTWVSEQQRVIAVTNQSGADAASLIYPSVDIYARLYNNQAAPLGNEFLVNTDNNVCANPSIAEGGDGGFMVAWGEQNLTAPTNGWDIYARPFSGFGTGGTQNLVNLYQYGDQYAPKIAALHTDYLIAWTSLAQDGSGSGVYGRIVRSNGTLPEGEFLINTTTVSSQMLPAVASDGNSQFEVVWSSFSAGSKTFDLFGQRYSDNAAVLPVMSAPYIWAPFVVSNGVYQPQLTVSWSGVPGISVSNYEVFLDGSTSPTAIVTSNQWVMTAANGLTASSTHVFQLNYVTTDGRSPAISPATSGTTWSTCNYMNSGIPCDWVAQEYGTNAWPYNVSTPLAPGGPTLLQVFLSGGDPLDSTTWLHTTLENTTQGLYVHWNCKPGFTYQVQTTANFTTWQNWGAPRFAATTEDSINVGSGSAGFYRVMLLR